MRFKRVFSLCIFLAVAPILQGKQLDKKPMPRRISITPNSIKPAVHTLVSYKSRLKPNNYITTTITVRDNSILGKSDMELYSWSSIIFALDGIIRKPLQVDSCAQDHIIYNTANSVPREIIFVFRLCETSRAKRHVQRRSATGKLYRISR